MAPRPGPGLAPRRSFTPPVSLAGPVAGASSARGVATAVLAAIFAVSGAAGLIYESIWTRYLGLFVGHSAYAQVIVLVIFLGGMSLGAFVVGEYSARLANPLAWYAGIELAVGVIGFAFHDIFVAVTGAAYDHWFPALAGGAGHTVVKWAIASLLILPQSVLLGTTFPLMSAGVLRLRARRTGHVLSLLYFANSIGAAIGVLVAGFELVQNFGLPGTLVVAAVLDFAAALAVWALLRLGTVTENAPPVTADAPLPVGEDTRALGRLLLLVSFGTALSSFIYEIGWIRMLSLVLGSATHSFELMLSAFILGLALGALWMRRHADRFADPVRALGVVQWVMGALAVATLPLYLETFRISSFLIQALDRTDEGYAVFGVARYGLCLLVMLPATCCAGMTLPLITRTLLLAGSGERAVGRVYGVNTLGSIVGAALAGLVLLPLIGLKPLLLVGALLDLALGALLVAHAWRRGGEWPRFAALGATATAALLLLVTGFAHFDRGWLASGVYRYGVLPAPGSQRFTYYHDGRTATVSTRADRSDSITILSLATNGKPDASLDSRWLAPYRDGDPLIPLTLDQSTQVLIPVLTLAHARDPRTVAVIGVGSGMTSHFALDDDRPRAVYTVEIEPQMIRGARQFYPANRRVFDDPRSHLVVDDAKSFFAAGGRQFDAILSEPSNPWVSGVSGLFTVEFYQRVRRHLTPDGVFGQWLHTYEIDDQLVLTVLAAIDRVFPDYAVFSTSGGDILVVASNHPSLAAPDWSLVRRPGMAAELRRVVPLTPGLFESLRLADRRSLHPWFAVEGHPNSDYYPLLDLGAERTRFRRDRAVGVAELGRGRVDIVGALAGRRRGFSDTQLPAVPELVRVRQSAVGSVLHALWAGQAPAADTLAPAVREAVYRMRAFQRGVAGSTAPSDWHGWLAGMDSAEQDLHDGTAGVADERFYGAVEQYLARTKAPAEVTTAVRFLHGVAAWQWAEARDAAPVLIASAQRGIDLVPLDVLREGAALSHIELADPHGAAAIFRSLAARTGREVRLRDQVLAAQVLAQERARRPAMEPAPGR